MAKLYVMVGIPGSGKSFAVQNKINTLNDWCVFSSDEYRKKLFGDENDQTHNQEVFVRLYKDLRSALTAGKNCVLDATNTNRKMRKRIFNQIQGIAGVEVIAYVMRTPIQLCIKRDSKRDRTVGVDVIDKFFKSYEFPQRFEGFSDIIVDNYPVDTSDACEKSMMEHQQVSFFYDILNEMKEYDQLNPHHVNNLYDHSRKLAQHYYENTPSWYAGILHDVGKLITQHLDDQGIAHYYSHDCAGTYYILSSSLYDYLGLHFDKYQLEYILFLVNYHMRGHKDIRDKAELKYRKLFGDNWYHDLTVFANADIDASETNSIHDKLKQWIKNDKLSLEAIRSKPEYIKLVEEKTEK